MFGLVGRWLIRFALFVLATYVIYALLGSVFSALGPVLPNIVLLIIIGLAIRLWIYRRQQL